MDRQEIKARKKFLLDTLIESGVYLNFVDEQGLTPLMHVAQLPDEKCRTDKEKRKTSSPRKVSSASLVTVDTKHKEKSQYARRRKYAWHERIMKHPISRKEEVEKVLELATTELERGADDANPDGISELSCSFDTKKSFIERQAIANSKGETRQVIHTVSNATSVRADTIRRSLNINTKLHPPNSAVGRKSKEICITCNHDRSYPSPKTSENAAVDDEYSWYLHFSVFIPYQCH